MCENTDGTRTFKYHLVKKKLKSWLIAPLSSSTLISSCSVCMCVCVCALPDCQPVHLFLMHRQLPTLREERKHSTDRKTPCCLSLSHMQPHMHSNALLLSPFTLVVTHPMQKCVTYVLPCINRLRKRKPEMGGVADQSG